jgi:hypothetical protein
MPFWKKLGHPLGVDNSGKEKMRLARSSTGHADMTRAVSNTLCQLGFGF